MKEPATRQFPWQTPGRTYEALLDRNRLILSLVYSRW